MMGSRRSVALASRSPRARSGPLGPNGAGKTTTVEILEGYRHATEVKRPSWGTIPATRHGRCGSASESSSSTPRWHRS